MSSELQAELLRIERQMWTNDAVVYAANLTDNAVLVFPETGVITRDIALEGIRRENAEGRRWAEVRFDSFSASMLSDETALLLYKATARWEHESSPISIYASSIYLRQSQAWKLIFHQETPIPSV